jgi:hypothetical protein
MSFTRIFPVLSVLIVAAVAFAVRAVAAQPSLEIGNDGLNALVFAAVLTAAGYGLVRTLLSRPTLATIPAKRGSARTGLKKFSVNDSLE